MNSTQTDLRTLRRGPHATPSMSLLTHGAPSRSALVPQPRGRWATRLVVPFAVLLATAGILAFTARDTFRARFAVHVAAAIPMGSAASIHRGWESPESRADGRDSDTAQLGPVVVQAPGWIEPAPFAVSVPALAEGVVSEVLVLEGTPVQAGQVVARLIDDDAKLLVRSAEAVIAQRTSDIARAGAALATAESQVVVERIAADELRDQVNRNRGLVDMGGVSVGDFRRMEIRLAGLEAKVATAEKIVSEARAVLAQDDAARDAALVTKDEALLKLSRMNIRSPVSGVVLARLVEPGSRISIGNKGGEGTSGGGMTGTVLRVYDPSKLQVRVDVPLADAAKVGVGTRAVVSTEAIADQTFTGVVSRVVHEANIQRNTVQFKVTLDAPSPVLKPEMLTRVKLHGPATTGQSLRSGASSGGSSDTAEGSGMILLVPVPSVTSTGEGKGQVWIVDIGSGSPVARLRDIATMSASDEGFVAVTSGLRLTDRVILDPPASPAIRDGTRLKLLGERTTAPSRTSPPTP